MIVFKVEPGDRLAVVEFPDGGAMMMESKMTTIFKQLYVSPRAWKACRAEWEDRSNADQYDIFLKMRAEQEKAQGALRRKWSN